METLNHILQNARQRAEQNGLPYAGALTPAEAQKVLELAPAAKLVDVRSRAELELVGRVPGASHIEWAFYPGMVANPDFLSQLNMQVDHEVLVMFLCRTGGRSHNAAVVATQAGYTEAFNILEGFEGESTTDSKQRGRINGWKAAGLPWTNA
ncbi:rhodanese-like domain-containing protein [Methylobacillus gramineus]|uniref:rhodanese-like domain-containing protein n=1 Tax=Methylobacillus gramineus TaxID=755169 RepID=UPI001CFFC4FF|nr:rhodanese-like domain-containing protein [Methylobacillus gramineus]MCB5186018.1 rhodanese-like domain-containing protein [Methylobacillus gramineus]